MPRLRAKAGAFAVPERLTRPHPVIARWRAVREEERRKARSSRDPWMRSWDPGEFTENERRRHRILDTLLKALEANGAKIREGEQGTLYAVVLGEDVEFAVREKYRHAKTSAGEGRQAGQSASLNGGPREIVYTGSRLLEVKRYLPSGFKRQWLETDAEPMDTLIADIVATIVSVGPLLVEERKAREEAERLRQLDQQRRYEEERRRKLDANRLRRLTDIAAQWRKLEIAREFLQALKGQAFEADRMIDGWSVAEWMVWAEEALRAADPLSAGAERVFADIGSTHEWTYRD